MTQIPISAPDKPPRPRRWIPLSLRMFLALLVLLGGGSALWIGIPAYQQHRAIHELKQVPGVTFLTDKTGLDHLRELKSLETLSLLGSAITDSGIERLKCLTNLQVIDVCATKVTDAGVAELERALPQARIDTGDGFAF